MTNQLIVNHTYYINLMLPNAFKIVRESICKFWVKTCVKRPYVTRVFAIEQIS